MTQCKLCGQYYGPFSMEKHLEEDHALADRTQDYERGYSDGRGQGQEDVRRSGHARAYRAPSIQRY